MQKKETPFFVLFVKLNLFFIKVCRGGSALRHALIVGGCNPCQNFNLLNKSLLMKLTPSYCHDY